MNILSLRLYSLQPIEINKAAIAYLDKMTDRAPLNLIATLTHVSRPTLYKWQDKNTPYDSINFKDAAWFILMCETNPKVKMLLDRPPLTRKHRARYVIED
jgi:hypothetical protein